MIDETQVREELYAFALVLVDKFATTGR